MSGGGGDGLDGVGGGGGFSGLKLSAPNGVKVYQVTSGKEVPKWLSEKNARKLRKDADYQRRIELIQDLEFSTAASRVKLSPDGNFLCVTGIHPPQVRTRGPSGPATPQTSGPTTWNSAGPVSHRAEP